MTESRLLRGIGVSPGLAYAPAVVLQWQFPDVPDRGVRPEQVEGEVRRLHDAVAAVTATLDALRERVRQRAGLEESRIFEAQILMVQDTDFLAGVERLIRENNLSAETAYEFKALELRAAWGQTGNVRLRERLADLLATQIRVLRHLMGDPDEELFGMGEHRHVIIVAHELYPGLTVQLDREQLLGLLAEEGTRTSHAAILAHSLGIPCVMGAAGAVSRIKSGTMILLDGTTGTVLIEPNVEPGLTNLLVGDASVREAVRPSVLPNLDVLPSGPFPPAYGVDNPCDPDGERFVVPRVKDFAVAIPNTDTADFVVLVRWCADDGDIAACPDTNAVGQGDGSNDRNETVVVTVTELVRLPRPPGLS